MRSTEETAKADTPVRGAKEPLTTLATSTATAKSKIGREPAFQQLDRHIAARRHIFHLIFTDFADGEIQVKDMASRRNVPIELLERWLAPNL